MSDSLYMERFRGIPVPLLGKERLGEVLFDFDFRQHHHVAGVVLEDLE